MEGISLYVQFAIAGLTMGTIYAMVGIGFSFIYRVTTVLNFAQGEFLMLGAMVAITMVSTAGLSVPLALLIGIVALIITGMLFHLGAIRVLGKAEPARMILITIAGSMFLQGTAFLIWGTDDYTLRPIVKAGTIEVLGAALNSQVFPVLIAAILITIVLKVFFDRTIWGKATAACAQSREASMLLGINVDRMGMLSFAMSAGIGAVGGILIAPICLMQYQKGIPLAIKGIAGAVVGGLGNIWGAMVGGILLGLVEAMSAGVIASYLTDVVVFVILMLVLFLKPEGLLGRAR
ncbi:MAG: branched-chain amino acid ABC transporter permease [Thermodesulfobacteriota bacterium]